MTCMFACSVYIILCQGFIQDFSLGGEHDTSVIDKTLSSFRGGYGGGVLGVLKHPPSAKTTYRFQWTLG